jgi:DNA-directed RNA polymerase subunit N (RpoN/RPB10)
MIIPIRCFTCNKIIANKWQKYINHINSGMDSNKAFIQIGIIKYCCKRMFLGHIDIINKIILYPEKKINY